MYDQGNYDEANYGGVEERTSYLVYGEGNYDEGNYTTEQPMRGSVVFGNAYTDAYRETLYPSGSRLSEVFLVQIDTDTWRMTHHPRFPETWVGAMNADSVRDTLYPSASRQSEVHTPGIATDTWWVTPYWTVAGRQLRPRVVEERTWQNLTLEFRLPRGFVKDRLDPIIQSPGKHELVTDSQGGFEFIDRSGGQGIGQEGDSNTYHVRAPEVLKRDVDLRGVETYLMDVYEKELVDKDGAQYNVELGMKPAAEKTFDNEWGWIEDPRGFYTGRAEDYDYGSEQWLFEFAASDVKIRTVSSQVVESTQSDLDRYELEMACSIRQTVTIEETAGLLGAVSEVQVPDGDNIMRDSTANQRHHVTIRPPDQQNSDVVPAGVYVVEEWTTEWVGNAYRVEMTVVADQPLSFSTVIDDFSEADKTASYQSENFGAGWEMVSEAGTAFEGVSRNAGTVLRVVRESSGGGVS